MGLRDGAMGCRRRKARTATRAQVESIVANHTMVFLFNFSDRQLHGVYIATSDGQENLSLSAWKGSAPTPKTAARKEDVGLELEDVDETDGSPFPAQCTFDILEEFAPVPEPEFRHVLEYPKAGRDGSRPLRGQRPTATLGPPSASGAPAHPGGKACQIVSPRKSPRGSPSCAPRRRMCTLKPLTGTRSGSASSSS